jgi:hypothetical protein
MIEYDPDNETCKKCKHKIDCAVVWNNSDYCPRQTGPDGMENIQ